MDKGRRTKCQGERVSSVGFLQVGMPHYEMVVDEHVVGGQPAWLTRRVNELLADGYELYGPPSVISTNKDGETIIVFSQALLKP